MDVQVWLADPGSPAIAEGIAGLLSADELARMARYRRPSDRRNYLVAHALVRAALSWAEPAIAPGAWDFRTDPGERPELSRPFEHLGLRFNLSHTQGLVGCVVSRGFAAGIDIECVDAVRDLDGLTRQVLAPSEREHLAAAAPADQARLFTRYWTLKEAYVKALGVGIRLPFTDLCFDLAPAEPELAAGPGPARWRFVQWEPGPGKVVAVALGAGRPLVVHPELPPGLGSG